MPEIDATPAEVQDYRARLSRGESGIDPERWADSLPAAQSEVGGGYGGYNSDHEFFGYRKSI